MKFTKKIAATVGALALGLSLAACGTDETTPAGDDGATETQDMGTITLGFVPSWTDGLSTAYLLENQLGEMGYTVEMEEIGDAALIYAALSQSDVDMYPSAWPEITHEDYMVEYGDKIEDLGAYYDNAQLTWAVPEYMDITSIEELKGMGDEFDGKVIGIEPGAGLTRTSLEKVLPEYELEDEYELVTSSTPAMLAELKKATDADESIVVTLWKPFWANAAFPVKTLEDPKGALGGSEALHFLGRIGFEEEFSDAADWIAELKLDDEQYGSLEDTVVNEFGEGKEKEAITAWIEANPDVLPAIN